MLIFGLKMAEMRQFCHVNLAKTGDPRTALKGPSGVHRFPNMGLTKLAHPHLEQKLSILSDLDVLNDVHGAFLLK